MPPQDAAQQSKQSSREDTLPERMHQCPTQSVGQRLIQHFPNQVHFLPPSNSSSSFRISASSAGVARFTASACITSFRADPENTRSSKCRSTCCWVCSSVRRVL